MNEFLKTLLTFLLTTCIAGCGLSLDFDDLGPFQDTDTDTDADTDTDNDSDTDTDVRKQFLFSLNNAIISK